jgi:hypothetical protein
MSVVIGQERGKPDEPLPVVNPLNLIYQWVILSQTVASASNMTTFGIKKLGRAAIPMTLRREKAVIRKNYKDLRSAFRW